MKSVTSSTDVHGIGYKERIKRMEKVTRVNEVEKKEPVTNVTYYDNKEKKLTPQQAYRKELAKSKNSKIYRELHREKEENKEEEEKER